MMRAVLFDWGDTVMVDYPQYSGPMVTWPEVSAVPGADEALKALRGRYQLVLVTNAAESGQELVRQALERVGLAAYFDRIFTWHEIGVRKPDPEFFLRVLRAIDVSPEEAVMVGDSYDKDVAGARGAGLRAVWYNSGGLSALEPSSHDAVISSMDELPASVAKL